MKLLNHPQTSTVVPLKFGINKWFHHTLYNGCNYLTMLGLKSNHVSKMGPLYHHGIISDQVSIYVFVPKTFGMCNWGPVILTCWCLSILCFFLFSFCELSAVGHVIHVKVLCFQELVITNGKVPAAGHSWRSRWHLPCFPRLYDQSHPQQGVVFNMTVHKPET